MQQREQNESICIQLEPLQKGAPAGSLLRTGTCLETVFRLDVTPGQTVESMSSGVLLRAMHKLKLPIVPVVASRASAAWLVANYSATSAPGNWQVLFGQ